MRRHATLLAALVVSSAAVVHLPAGHAVDPEWSGSATRIAGTSRYDGGEWVYSDFVFDDFGADAGAGQPNVVSLAPTVGDARYPDGAAYADNAADIVEVRVRPNAGDASDLDLRVTLQTLVDPAVAAVWVSVGGVEHVVTAQTPGAVVDAAANTIAVTLDGAAAGSTLSLNVGAGLHDGSGGLRAGRPGNASMYPNDYTTGGPTENRLFDAAFNTREAEGRGGAWNEEAQAKALAAGDVARFAQTIDLDALRAGTTTDLTLTPGYYIRLLESRQGIAEGMRSSFPQFGGRVQPYTLWIPEGYDGSTSTPLFLNMHSLSVHHNQYRGGTSPTYRTFYEQTGDALGAVVVTPLGRGPDGWYRDEALVDTLEVWSDAVASFPIDRERVLVGGYSMGGHGTYRLATMMPDSFASAVSVVGPPTDGIWTGLDMPADNPNFTYPQLENTRHVPFWITHGVADELVPVLGVTRQAERFGALGHEYRFALHPTADHFSFSVQDVWSRETAWFASHSTRVTNPAEVVLKVRPASLLSEDKAALEPLVRTLLGEVGARVDGAYWVDDVVVAGEGDVTGVVDLRSDGIARRVGAATPVRTAGIDGPSPHLLTGNDVAVDTAATEDVLRGLLTNVSSLTVDVGRAGLSDSPTLDVGTDRPVTITFVRNGVAVGQTTIGA